MSNITFWEKIGHEWPQFGSMTSFIGNFHAILSNICILTGLTSFLSPKSIHWVVQQDQQNVPNKKMVMNGPEVNL